MLFTVHALREGIAEPERVRAREEFFARPQACLRSSPLGKTYGWGTHHDAEGRVALVGVETERYRLLAAGRDEADRPLTVVRAMRRSRR
ncbi:DUF6157 family protein [Georgenia soli]|uniref:DUF6157 family protein n=1 Tax=Georgenia soli TaxID=638953 RepID=UPI001FED0969|nr:DUF6157 family protein [Georgenia soli]